MQSTRKKWERGVELQEWLEFHLYASERDVALQVAVRQPGGEMWANKTLARKRDPQSLFLLELILEEPERVASRLWPELEPIFGGPGWERETALASACGWPASPEELKRHIDLLWAAFDLWLASNPKVSEWCPEEAARLLTVRRPSERFLATSPESLVQKTKETGCRSFLDAFPELRTWFEIREELRSHLAIVGAEPWPL